MNESDPSIRCKRIATEEAYAPSDMLERYRGLIRDHSSFDPG